MVTQGYVIGENYLRLLRLDGPSIWQCMNGANPDVPQLIHTGYRLLPEGATIFYDWESANNALTIIKEYGDDIRMMNNSIIGGMIDGDRIKNPDNLKIFKILLHDVTEADKSSFQCYDEIAKDTAEYADV